ncbi:MAG: site-specific DNA-methyltransferase, partial [Tabrizicola sp.]
MADPRLDRLESILLTLLPVDGSKVPNGQLRPKWVQAAAAAGEAVTEAEFDAIRDRMVAAGLLLKGPGRGGATGRAAGAAPGADDFELQTGEAPDDEPAAKAKPAAKPKAKATPTPRAAADEPAQVISYRHADRRKNNPEVGLVNEASDPQQPKKAWAYSPHLDPVLNFDSSRAELENLVVDALSSGLEHDAQQQGEVLAWLDHALAGGNAAAVREVITNLRERLVKQKAERPERKALEEIQRRGAPYLQWAGKAERTSFEVDTVSLHVHERIDPMSILSAVRRRLEEVNDARGKTAAKIKAEEPSPLGRQASLFEAPFESLPLRAAVDFYRHDKGWANRLIAGDSLLVMNSLLVKEGMAGQVQMIYIDPPYGIRYGSNFQPFVSKKQVEDKNDADLTCEPEMIKAFRDTWELGVHSYLTYLRDRLVLAAQLLSETGSVFVQISDENLHHVRELMDDVFGASNFCGEIRAIKTSGQTDERLATVTDNLVWYAKNRDAAKFRRLFEEKAVGFEEVGQYYYAEHRTGLRRRLSQAEISGETALADAMRPFRISDISSNKPYSLGKVPFDLFGQEFLPAAARFWTHSPEGRDRLKRAGRLMSFGSSVRFVGYLDDFPLVPRTALWTDTGSSGFAGDKVYVVQTNQRIIERCLLMCSDPGDLVLDPTCGSATTAFVAEKWGRRWITCDTSRVAVTLAKQRLMTASYDYYQLAYPHEGLKGGFIYKTVPHVTLKSIANNADIDAIYERLHPAIEEALAALNAAFAQHPPRDPLTVTEGVRKGQKLQLGARGVALHEWEVPFPADSPQETGNEVALPPGWPDALREPFDAFHAARQRMQAEMDRSIAANAENETLYNKPEPSKTKLRITGPFTVEAVPFPTVLSLEAAEGGASAT